MQKRFIYFLFLLCSVSQIVLTHNWRTTQSHPSQSSSQPEYAIDQATISGNVRILQDADGTTTFDDTTSPLEAEPTHGGHVEHSEHETKFTPEQSEFWVCILVAGLLILFAGAMSGLTVGYLSIDELQLELKLKNGTESEKADAMIIIPILAKHHLLLSTLLLANAFAMETLPLFLDAIMPAVAAIIVSTSAVVIFGEIVPQAYCTGPNQIKIARAMAPIIKFLMFAFWPVLLSHQCNFGSHSRHSSKDKIRETGPQSFNRAP